VREDKRKVAAGTAAIATREAEVAVELKRIEAHENELREKEKNINERDRRVTDNERTYASRETSLTTRTQRVTDKETELATRERQYTEANAKLTVRERDLAIKATRTAEDLAQATKIEDFCVKKEQENTAAEKALDEREGKVRAAEIASEERLSNVVCYLYSHKWTLSRLTSKQSPREAHLVILTTLHDEIGPRSTKGNERCPRERTRCYRP
jgi:chromosome segregation ATPase